MTVGRSAASAWRSAGSKRGVGLDPDAAGADGPRDRGEVDRPEVGRDRRRPALRPAAVLVHPDRAVALVVEDDRDDLGLLADGRLELGHRHREAAVAGEGDDDPIAVDERRGDRGRQRVAHRARRRPEERARAAEPEAARQPQPEVAGVGRDDRVVGQESAGASRSRGRGGRRGRPRPSRRRPSPPPRRRGPRRWRRGGRRRPRRRGRAASSRATAARRNARASARTLRVGVRQARLGSRRGSRSTWAQRWPRPGSVYPNEVISRQAAAEDEQRVAGSSALADDRGAAVAGHARGTAGGRSR